MEEAPTPVTDWLEAIVDIHPLTPPSVTTCPLESSQTYIIEHHKSLVALLLSDCDYYN